MIFSLNDAVRSAAFSRDVAREMIVSFDSQDSGSQKRWISMGMRENSTNYLQVNELPLVILHSGFWVCLVKMLRGYAVKGLCQSCTQSIERRLWCMLVVPSLSFRPYAKTLSKPCLPLLLAPPRALILPESTFLYDRKTVR